MTNRKLSRDDMFNYIVNHETTEPEALSLTADMEFPPRYYQVNAVRTAVDYLGVGFRRLLYVSPTGSGKTVLARMTATSNEIRDALGINEKIKANPDYKVRVLMIAGAERLLTQARDTFEGCDDVELITHSAFMEVPQHIVDEGWDLTFIDEAHHEAMTSIQKLLDVVAEKPIFGLTATPDRGDGLMLKFERFIYAITKEEAIRRKFISVPSINSIIDSSGSNKLDIAKQVMELYGDEMGQTIVYFKTQKECRAFHEFLVELGYKSHFLKNEDNMDSVIKSFERKEIQFLINCQKLGEGVDIKGCTDVFLARQFNSKAEKEQYIGRSIRIDSKSVTWEFVSPFKNNILAKDLFRVVLYHRLIYKQKGDWYENYLEKNNPEDIYDYEYLDQVA